MESMPRSGLGLAQAENQIYEVRSQNRSGNLEVESPLLCFIFWKIFWTDGPPFPWTALSARRSGVAALHQANIPISAFQTFISTLALSQIGPPPTHPPVFSRSFSPNWLCGRLLPNSYVFHPCLVFQSWDLCQNDAFLIYSGDN